ncbi:hypothetical protein SAMCCGM7_pB0040 (plasmid) [Sinorhizobium americanum CCGM7]|nr:hypothetical protein SAMCCGM7_pB0040 [Sinorhizobium americanum CCGM7]
MGRCIAHPPRYRRASRFVAWGSMRQQTEPFIVETKPSRKLKQIDRKTSI